MLRPSFKAWQSHVRLEKYTRAREPREETLPSPRRGGGPEPPQDGSDALEPDREPYGMTLPSAPYDISVAEQLRAIERTLDDIREELDENDARIRNHSEHNNAWFMEDATRLTNLETQARDRFHALETQVGNLNQTHMSAEMKSLHDLVIITLAQARSLVSRSAR